MADRDGLNLTAPFFLAQAFANTLIRGGNAGSIINMASINSFQGGVEVPAYAASKHGLLGMTRALRTSGPPMGCESMRSPLAT